jgi:hypothetical protein
MSYVIERRTNTFACLQPINTDSALKKTILTAANYKLGASDIRGR